MKHRSNFKKYFGMLSKQNESSVLYKNGTTIYWRKDQIHREDGPAYIHPNGNQEWWITDIEITAEVNSWTKENDFPDYALWTDGQKIMFRLAFSGITS